MTRTMRSRPLLISLVVLAMIAFAANSLLCRAALKATRIDPGSFTLIRLGAGALVLAVIAGFRRAALPAARWLSALPTEGSWLSGLGPFAHSAGFSFRHWQFAAAVCA